MKQKIKYGSQFIDKRDISLVAKSLVESHITTGNFVKKFAIDKSKNKPQINGVCFKKFN